MCTRSAKLSKKASSGFGEARRAGRGLQEAKRLLSEGVARRRRAYALAPEAGEHAPRDTGSKFASALPEG